MSLARRLQRLDPPRSKDATPRATIAGEARPAPALNAEPTTPAADTSPEDRLAALRARIRALETRAPVQPPPRVDDLPVLRLERIERSEGTVHVHRRVFPVTHRHGLAPLHTALDLTGPQAARLGLAPELASFDPARTLFLDTETTGLAGGSGTLAFLVGVAWFEGGSFVVEQLFLPSPADEPAMLAHLAEHYARAGSIVTFNGKSFDVPLLQSRFVLSRLRPTQPSIHLDLVHVARRIYGARLEGCRLTTLERDVLGFVREGDVPSGEIPQRYVDFLRGRGAGPLLPVLEHNVWDVVAMAALLGELAQRIEGLGAPGRFEPEDLVGLARTFARAGAPDRAASMASDAAELARSRRSARARREAGLLGAELNRKLGDHDAAERAWLDALQASPGDPALHLRLAIHYEHRRKDPRTALAYARGAVGAEPADVHGRRIDRLMRKLARGPGFLPGLG